MSGWTLTEEQELLSESVKEFCARNVSEAKIKEWYEAHCVSDEFNKAFYDAGFGLMGIQEEYGGIPVDKVTQAILVEELTRGCGALMPSPSYIQIGYDICEMGTPEQIKFFMDRYKKNGTAAVGFAISEPCAGSDNAAMVTTAKKNADGKIVLNGSKTFCSNARNCDYLLIVAKDEDPSRENRKMSLWLVPINTPGVKLVHVEELGNRLQPFSDVYLDNVVIDESCLLGQRGTGFMNLMKNFEMERVLVAANCLGLAQAAMDDAAAYASERCTFGQPIGNYQLIQLKLVEMEVRLQNMRNLIYKTASDLDNGVPGHLSTALLKFYVGKAASEVCNDALQIFGGIGYTTDCRVSRLWAEARGMEIGGGTAEIMVKIAGKLLLNKYKK